MGEATAGWSVLTSTHGGRRRGSPSGPRKGADLNRFLKSAAFPILIVILLVFVAQRLVVSDEDKAPPPTFPALISDISAGEVARATIKTESNEVSATLKDGTKIDTGYIPEDSQALTDALDQAHVPYEIKGIPGSPWWSSLIWLAPFVLFIVFWIYLMNRMQGGGSKVMSFGKSRAKRMAVDAPKITFKDVAGVAEAVEELQEIKEFLENPKKFQSLGARIPKGVLLFGPPGTGKTLLARAVAGEAGVPFFSISGSDFVEMFVGVGASRVRDLFEQAKQNNPCIIFMDEIDAVGRHRGAGLGGGHDEREQTLNQLLVEMDGFETKDNIILIAATNRPDILDPALLRPGRFDRQIVVDRPDRDGRAQILAVHTKGKPIAKEINLGALAGQTPGFTGADLANLVNEAALLARPQGQARDRAGRAGRGDHARDRRPREEEPAALREGARGHRLPRDGPRPGGPLPGQRRPGAQDQRGQSRGQALGYTISMPVEDKFLTTKGQLEDAMAMTLGGRAAEEIVFDEITTGAANDLEKVTSTAKSMTMRFGMSDKLGPRVLGHNQGAPFLGRDMHSEPDYSDDMARTIDSEIRRIIEEAHQRARDILVEHRADLESLSGILLRRETIEREEFLALLEGTPEAQVFAERDRRAAELEAEAKREAAEPERRKRMPYPPAGDPIPEG